MTDDHSEPARDDDGRTFDIYHFFSRRDVLLAVAVVLLLLLYVLSKWIFGTGLHGAV